MDDLSRVEYSPVARSLYQPNTNDLHGSARWATADELYQRQMLGVGSAGVLLGQTLQGQPICFNGDGHILVFAPTGAGKGIGFVQPNLAAYPGSIVVLDPKGENAAVSARHRANHPQLKQRVVVLDPFSKTGMRSARFNPLERLSRLQSNYLMPEVRGVAEALVPLRGGSDEAHWINGARMFVQGLLLLLLAHEPPENRHLLRLHELAFSPVARLHQLFKGLAKGTAEDPILARLCRAYGNWWEGREERELSYFLSIAYQELTWIGDGVWADILTGESDQINPKLESLSLYLVLPWDLVATYRNWLRLMVQTLIAGLVSVPGQPEWPVLFLMDEAYVALGRLEIILHGAAALRSAGGRLALIYQDLPQLKSLYRQEWASFIGNAGASIFFSVNDSEGAAFVSERCGTGTVPVAGSPTGQGRRLLNPDEVMTLNEDEIIGFFRNMRPGRFGRLNVLEDERFRHFLDDNPEYRRVLPSSNGLGSFFRRGWVPIDTSEATEDGKPSKKAKKGNKNKDPKSAPEDKPLPKGKPARSAIQQQQDRMTAALNTQFKRQDIAWQEKDQAYGYVDDEGYLVLIQ